MTNEKLKQRMFSKPMPSLVTFNLLPSEGPGVGDRFHHHHDAVLRLLGLFFLGLVRGLLARRHAEKLVTNLLEELFFLRRGAVFHVLVHYLVRNELRW